MGLLFLFLVLFLNACHQLCQQPRGLFDLVQQRRAGLRMLLPMQGPFGNGHHLPQIVLQPVCCCRLLLLLGFQKQLRRRQNALLRPPVARATPGLVQRRGFPRRPMRLGEDLRHALALVQIQTRHRCQVAHGNLRRDAALAHLALHRFRQRLH